MTVPDVYRALWRHKVMIVVLTAAVVAAAWYLTSRETPVYRAATLVRIQQHVSSTSDVFLSLQTAGRLAQTYERIAQTSTIAREIERELHGQVPYRDIRIGAKQVADLELLTITAESRSPGRAQLVANAAPAALRTFIKNSGTSQEQVITIQAASRPHAPISPKRKLNLALALVLGLIFNGALALVLHRLADRVEEPEEVERITGKPVLAVVPLLTFASAAGAAGREAGDAEQTKVGETA